MSLLRFIWIFQDCSLLQTIFLNINLDSKRSFFSHKVIFSSQPMLQFSINVDLFYDWAVDLGIYAPNMSDSYYLFQDSIAFLKKITSMEFQFLNEGDHEESLFQALLKPDSRTLKKTTVNSDLIEEQIEIRDLPNSVNTPIGQGSFDLFFENCSPQKSLPDFDQNSNKKLSKSDPNLEVIEAQEEANQIKECEFQVSEKETSHVFRWKNIRKENKKNTNFPKFIVRLFLKYMKTSDFETEAGSKHFQKIKSILSKRKTNNYNIQDVKNLLCLEDVQIPEIEGIAEKCLLGLQFRKHLANLLKWHQKDEILENNYVSRNRLEYCIASKVYALRCRSALLVERVQNK